MRLWDFRLDHGTASQPSAVGGSEVRRRAWRRPRETLGVFGAVTVMVVAIASASDAGFLDFKEGIRAQDQKQWELSATLMSRAAARGQEDGRLVRIYGTRYIPYLPWFYLGYADFQLHKCAAALDAWQKSLAAGAVQGTEEGKELEKLRPQCQGHATP